MQVLQKIKNALCLRFYIIAICFVSSKSHWCELDNDQNTMHRSGESRKVVFN